MRPIIAALLFTASPVAAQEWSPLDGAGVRAALIGEKLVYETAWQTFSESGKTLYNAGRDSWGNWRIQGDQYCSQWAPNAAWACYDVDISADATSIRFRGRGDDVSVGAFAE